MREEELVIPVVAILMPLVLVPMVMVLKHRQRRREWDHKERMRALELGVEAPGSAFGTFWPSMAAIAIGAGVPASAFLFSWLASMTAHVGDDIWTAAGFVGCIAVVCGTSLAGKMMGMKSCGDRKPAEVKAPKPHQYDPDAYDTVGRRG